MLSCYACIGTHQVRNIHPCFSVCIDTLVDSGHVLCRELAQQIAGAARPLKKLFGLSSLCLYGGVDKQRQVTPASVVPCLTHLAGVT